MSLARRILSSNDDLSALRDFSIFNWTTVGVRPVANRAYYTPFYIPDSFDVTHLWWGIGGDTGGNVCAAIYRASDLARVVTTGSIAKNLAGTNGLQSAAVTATTLPAGRYLYGYAQDGTTLAMVPNLVVWQLQVAGIRAEAGAFPLPATANPGTLAEAVAPWMGALNGAGVMI